MPIVTDSDSLTSKSNDITNNLNSLEDEESFVVLERLTANDPGPLDVTIQSLHSFQAFSNSTSYPAFNNLSTNDATSNGSNLHHSQFETVPEQPIGLRFDSNNISVSVEDIQKQLQEVLRDNVNLKENLFQTNLAMKQHMSTVRLLQDRASEVQKNHQAKFEETKALILQLGSEKVELQETNNSLTGELNKAKQEIKEIKEVNLTFGNEMTKILSENESLKKQLTSIQESMQTVTENSKKASLQPTAKEVELHELVDHLTRKLEGVERSRRQQEFDIDRLKAQLGRAMQELGETQRRLALTENDLQIEKGKSSPPSDSGNSSLECREKFTKYLELLNRLKTSVQDEQTRCDSLVSWLALDPVQFEISELRRLLAEEQTQSIARKESLCVAVATIHELLTDLKNTVDELDRIKADRAVKESHSLAYDEIQKKGFTERLDALTAKYVEKEQALEVAQRHLASLQAAVEMQNAEKKNALPSSALDEGIERIWGFSYEDILKIFVHTRPKSVDVTNQIAAKDEQLQANNKEIISLKSEMEKLQVIADTAVLMEEQIKLYKDDFEEERRSRESMAAEKERLLEDLRHLQLRNEKLIEELKEGKTAERLPTAPPANVNNRQDRTPAPAPPRPQDDVVPPPKRYYCPNPNCNKAFTEVEPLELHVITCLQLD